MLKLLYRGFYFLFLAAVLASLLGGTVFHQVFESAAVSSLEVIGISEAGFEDGDRRIDSVCQWKDIWEAWIAKVRDANTWQEYKEMFKVPEVKMTEHEFLRKRVYDPIVGLATLALRLLLFAFSFSFLIAAIILHLVHVIMSFMRRIKSLEERISLLEAASDERTERMPS